MSQVIATFSLFGQRPGEEPFKITVEIGMPYKSGVNPEEWACPVNVEPLYHRLHDVYGENSFQSLSLAISLAQLLLWDFEDKGGVLLSETGDKFPLEAYSLKSAQEAKVAQLTDDEIQAIDDALLSYARPQWQKFAMVVARAMDDLNDQIPGIPDLFYAHRIRKLVKDGHLESQGNLLYMRFSEVRLPVPHVP